MYRVNALRIEMLNKKRGQKNPVKKNSGEIC